MSQPSWMADHRPEGWMVNVRSEALRRLDIEEGMARTRIVVPTDTVTVHVYDVLPAGTLVAIVDGTPPTIEKLIYSHEGKTYEVR